MLLAITKVLQELGVHPLQGHRYELARLLDAICMATHSVVAASMVLLLVSSEPRERGRKCNENNK